MATYISLLRFTNQGIRQIQDSPHRADIFGQMAENAGVKVLAQDLIDAEPLARPTPTS